MISPTWRRHVRSAVTLNPSPSRWRVALKASATIVIVLGAPLAAGNLRLGMLASLGTFAVLYGPTTARRHRLRLLLWVAAGLIASAAAGALTAGHPTASVLGFALTASAATFACLALRVGPPGAFFFVLVHGVASLAAGHGTSPGLVVTATAGGAAVAVAMGMSDLVFEPTRPERQAVEAAEAAMDRFEAACDATDLGPTRYAASTALHAAWTVVTDAGSPAAFTTRLWAVQDRYSAATARITGGLLGIDPAPWDSDRDVAAAEDAVDAPRTTPDARRVDAEQIRDTSLGRPSGLHLVLRAARWPSEVLLVTTRVAVAALLGGALSVAIGVEHVYWTVAFTTLVLHQGGTRDAQIVRGVQRVGGTVVGLGLFAALAGVGPTGWGLVAVVAALQFAIEMLVVRNYGIAVAVITPLALTIGSNAAGHRPPGPLIVERGVDTLLAVLVAGAVLFVVGRGVSVTLLRGYAREVVLAIDAVLADLAAGRVETRDAREHRRRLYHELLESDGMARRVYADDPDRVAPYREMERSLSDLGYVVLGLAWHPDTRSARGLFDEAREPLARIVEHSVRGTRSADDIHADVLAVERTVTTWAPRTD